jgi:hypothetical protein
MDKVAEKFPFALLVTFFDVNVLSCFSSDTCTHTSEACSLSYLIQPCKSIVSLDRNSVFFKYGIGFEICIAKTFNGFEKLNIIVINNIIDKMGFLEPIEFAKFVITV